MVGECWYLSVTLSTHTTQDRAGTTTPPLQPTHPPIQTSQHIQMNTHRQKAEAESFSTCARDFLVGISPMLYSFVSSCVVCVRAFCA